MCCDAWRGRPETGAHTARSGGTGGGPYPTARARPLISNWHSMLRKGLPRRRVRCAWTTASFRQPAGVVSSPPVLARLRGSSGPMTASVAARAGHSVAMPQSTYAHCIDGDEEIMNRRIDAALGARPTPVAERAEQTAPPLSRPRVRVPRVPADDHTVDHRDTPGKLADGTPAQVRTVWGR